jgi:hypothetical protein
MRRTWLRGRENVHKRYLIHVAGHNIGILMRLLVGTGTPREAAARGLAYLLFVYTGEAVAIILVAAWNCQEFRAGLGMMGAKEPDHAESQRASYS